QVDTDFPASSARFPWHEAAVRRNYRTSIALPLISGQKAFGALTIYSAEADSFTGEEVQLLQELADDLSFGIETLRGRIQRERAEAKLAFLAHHDPLTNLPNRLLLRDRFAQAIALADREGSGLAMLYLDLDHFKQINDSLGHDVGDQLLVGVVGRLGQCVRDTDTVSRQGGDEFILLLSNADDPAMISRIAQGIVDAFEEPFSIGADMLSTSVSIGISLYPSDGTDFETLLKNADTALYHAKDSGRETFRFFTPMMNAHALARMQLQTQLRGALKNEEFLLHYQPQIDIATGRVVGMEALLRWQRPGEAMIPPGSFIPAAEQSGLIIPIGEWVLNEACRQAKAWQDEGLPSLVVAVNLSALQFKRGDILGTVAGALERSGLAACRLELELTESILLEDSEGAMAVLRQFKEMGVKLSIDDFGTGYSSLSYLKRLAVDKLKIDQSFMRDIAAESDGSVIVKAIIDLGHSLQLVVIAEGVETERQLAFLKRHGCDEVQGYLFSRPVPPKEFVEFVEFVGRKREKLKEMT
ncbi:MAG: EAL domain-containing protein, partial [Rhodospirillales bacterium]|nr:EAL domain-containing protein [Rhodospirillales bacterium]